MNGRALIGHDLRQTWVQTGTWRALCECGEMFRALREYAVVDLWRAHWDEERENAGLP